MTSRGTVMHSANVYTIYYGANWSQDSSQTEALILAEDLLDAPDGEVHATFLSTYYDASGSVVPSQVRSVMSLADTTYSQGKNLTDALTQKIVSNAIQSGNLPKDSNGIYVVALDKAVTSSSGTAKLCTDYCGYNTHATLQGIDVKYAQVSYGGGPSCNACQWGFRTPTNAATDAFGIADKFASNVLHEVYEIVTDPDGLGGNGWESSGTGVNTQPSDFCQNQFGNYYTIAGGGGTTAFANTHLALLS